MLTKLISVDISRLWDSVLKLAIKESIPPYVLLRNNTLTNILEELLVGNIHCWIAHEPVESLEDELRIYAVIFTTFFDDICSRTKSLMIYGIFALTLIPDLVWDEGIETLMKFGKEKDCSLIVGYSSNPIILQKVEALGGNTDYRYVTVPIE